MAKGYINARLNLKEYSMDELKAMQKEIEDELCRRGGYDTPKVRIREDFTDEYLEYQKLIHRLING